MINFWAFSIVTATAFLSCKMSTNSFAKLMECAVRKRITSTCMLLTLCPGYKLFTACLESPYLSLLNVVLDCIIPGTHTVPSIMYQSLFILSRTLISGLLAPFLGHFPRYYGISHNTFALSFSKHGTGWLCLYQGREFSDSLNSFFSSMLWYRGRNIWLCLSLWSVCAIFEKPHRMWIPFLHCWSIPSTLSCNFSFQYILVLINIVV